jgi:hypothetical protein
MLPSGSVWNPARCLAGTRLTSSGGAVGAGQASGPDGS